MVWRELVSARIRVVQLQAIGASWKRFYRLARGGYVTKYGTKSALRVRQCCSLTVREAASAFEYGVSGATDFVEEVPCLGQSQVTETFRYQTFNSKAPVVIVAGDLYSDSPS